MNIACTRAVVEKNNAKVESISSDMVSLASQISSSNSELIAAILGNEKDTKDFSTSEAELMDVVDTFQHNTKIIQEGDDQEPRSLAEED